jgi:isopropylmalate/homocitrate/citramalate synthase
MTTLTNEQMFKKVITIIKKMDINEDDDFDTEMNKVIAKAKKGKPSKKTKEVKEDKVLTAYQQFVKDKMPEVKDKYDPKDRMKAIAELWKEQKESSSE